ncbi:hypothetical protein QJS10_CPB22g00007 [Acorus calamus]|uniref:Tic22-like family protein n=1 Tax=Acorus calamus TaxID=4465 RepID=A0AAV9BXY4_ACOCL|nr:hypothetical protein QJS10_CPB22g00007 [Acorus calamus]
MASEIRLPSSPQPPRYNDLGGRGVGDFFGAVARFVKPVISQFLPPHICPTITIPPTVLFSLPPLMSSSPSSSSAAAVVSKRSSTFPGSVRIDGLRGVGGGPAFVGQVFSMCDPSGTGLMAVTTHLHIPFLPKRLLVNKSEKNGPVFRFFMDVGDAVSYVKHLNIPTGMVGACRLDVAYEHFKEKPHMFQFVPNIKQVKMANKLLETISRRTGKRRLEGVPVFTAQNLNIAIATTDGIKWYTPYFFDKGLLDDILETSVDQHFHSLIQNRHVQRRREVVDDNFSAEVVEENGEFYDPPEVQEVLDEMGHPGLPLSVISKAAEVQLLDVVDKVLLGNRWLRKATGIQPKFPYMVDSFEARSAASFAKASEFTSFADKIEACDATSSQLSQGKVDTGNDFGWSSENSPSQQTSSPDFRFPFGDWISNPWLKRPSIENKSKNQIKSNARMSEPQVDCIYQLHANPLLPKITMVGISTGEAGQMSRASFKKTMEELTKELEQTSQRQMSSAENDPLFIANVGDYSNITRASMS